MTVSIWQKMSICLKYGLSKIIKAVGVPTALFRFFFVLSFFSLLILRAHFRTAAAAAVIVTISYRFIHGVNSIYYCSSSNCNFYKLFKTHKNTSFLYYKIKMKLSKRWQTDKILRLKSF